MVYFLMTSLGELAWNYWYAWAVTIAADLVASQIIMAYWFPDVPGFVWSAAFLAVITLLNLGSVKLFGETEYWFALVKVATIVVFIGGEAPVAGGFAALIFWRILLFNTSGMLGSSRGWASRSATTGSGGATCSRATTWRGCPTWRGSSRSARCSRSCCAWW